MTQSVTWNGSARSIPDSGETGWQSLTDFLKDLGDNAATVNVKKQANRVATSTPVTVSNTTDCVVVCKLTVAGAVAVNLPAGATGRFFYIVDGTGDAATNNITIDANSTETINGALTYVINDNYGGVVLAWNGTQWNVVSRYVGGAVLANPYASVMSFTNTTDATSASSAALKCSGGIAATKQIWCETTMVAKAGIKVLDTGIGSDTLNFYEEADHATTFTFNGTGSPGTSGSCTIKVTRVGRVITLFGTAVTATSGTGSTYKASDTALPTWARPSGNVYAFSPIVKNNGTDQTNAGLMQINSSGTIFVFRDGLGTAYTNATVCGLSNPWLFTYSIT